MSKKKKLLRCISVSFIFAVVLLIAIKLIIDLSFRNSLPDLPDLQNLPTALKEQILETSKKASRNPSSENIGMLGMVYHSSAYYEQAAVCYKMAARKNKSEWLWSYYLGYLNQEMGASDAAIENFKKVIQIDPDVYHAWYYMGEGFRNLGVNQKAEMAFKKIVNLQEKITPENQNARIDYFPLRIYAMFQLSRIYLSSDRVDLAERNLKQILQARRSFGPAYRLLATVYRLKGDSILTSYYMIRANDLADYSPPVDTLIDKLTMLSKSELYLLKQIDLAERSIYPEWALAIAKHGIKQIPNNKYLLSKTIKLLLKLGYGNEALPYLQKHIGLYRDDFDEILEIARLLSDKGYLSQSLIYYNLAVNLNPSNIKAQADLALCLWENGMQEIAINQFTDFIEKNRNEPEGLSEAISFFILVDERQKAVSYLDQFKRISVSDPRIKKFEGMIAEVDGLYNKAIALYESSLRDDPTNISTIRYLGNLLMKQNNWEKSIIHYSKALDYHPNAPDLLERLGNLLVSCPIISLKDYNKARELSERALIHKDSSPEVLISSAKNLAEAYWALADEKNAVSFMNIALNLAKTQNVKKIYIDELENRLKQFTAKN